MRLLFVSFFVFVSMVSHSQETVFKFTANQYHNFYKDSMQMYLLSTNWVDTSVVITVNTLADKIIFKSKNTEEFLILKSWKPYSTAVGNKVFYWKSIDENKIPLTIRLVVIDGKNTGMFYLDYPEIGWVYLVKW